jgi:tRNA A-37 threonylcarbamoyl transferase component Bud32
MPAPDPVPCSRCGEPLPPAGPPCPHCLLALGVALPPRDPEGRAHASDPDASAPRTGSRRIPTPDELARHFPGLEIQEPIGQGGMGIVYRARQKKLDRLVALKILAPELAGDPAFAERFLREARAMARLRHPNIVAVHDFGETEGLCWLVMEHVDGVNLRAALKTGALTPQRALYIVPLLCDALQTAHDLGVVHRDIKPENVLLARDGGVKIADFGLAKLSGVVAEAALTSSDVGMGTLHYMAPEQLQGAHAVDHRADIFSLGVVFYEMLTGALPIGRFDPPSARARIDVRLDEIVLRALEHEPERRYQHAVEVKTDVQAVRTAPAEPEAPPAPATTPERPAAERASGRRVGWVGPVLWLIALPTMARLLFDDDLGAWGFGGLALLAAGWLAWVVLRVARRDPELAQALRGRSPAAERTRIAVFVGLSAAAALVAGAGLESLWRLGTDHYADPIPFARASVEPWDEDRAYTLLQLLPASESPYRPSHVLYGRKENAETPPELGRAQRDRYRIAYPASPALTLFLSACGLAAGAAVYLGSVRARSAVRTCGVIGAAPLAGAAALLVGFGRMQLAQSGKPDTLEGIGGSTALEAEVEAVRAALAQGLSEDGYALTVEVGETFVEKRSGAAVARHELLAAEPASVFARWKLGDDGPRRVWPGLVFDLVGSPDGLHTALTWNAGMVRAGERVGDDWRVRVERLLERVRTASTGSAGVESGGR